MRVDMSIVVSTKCCPTGTRCMSKRVSKLMSLHMSKCVPKHVPKYMPKHMYKHMLQYMGAVQEASCETKPTLLGCQAAEAQEATDKDLAID